MVCLKSGFCLEADSHSIADGTVVLHVGAGTLEYAAGDIASLEPLAERNIAASTVPSTARVHLLTTEELLSEAAKEEGIYPELVRSVARVESNFRQKAVSQKGAVGLMQLMPLTAAGLGVDAAKAPENALGGAKYLRALLLRYHGDSALALAAYNAGPAAVDRFHGVPPYEETRNYVVKVLREYQRQHRLPGTTKDVAAAVR